VCTQYAIRIGIHHQLHQRLLGRLREGQFHRLEAALENHPLVAIFQCLFFGQSHRPYIGLASHFVSLQGQHSACASKVAIASVSSLAIPAQSENQQGCHDSIVLGETIRAAIWHERSGDARQAVPLGL
jgi:hypothetical protein